MGEEIADGWTQSDLYYVLPAIRCYFSELRAVFPAADIYGVCNCEIRREIVGAIKNACAAIGAKAIELHDVDKIAGHPTARGMIEIKDQILTAIKK